MNVRPLGKIYIHVITMHSSTSNPITLGSPSKSQTIFVLTVAIPSIHTFLSHTFPIMMDL